MGALCILSGLSALWPLLAALLEQF